MKTVYDLIKEFRPRIVSTISYNNGKYVKVEYGHYEVDELLQILDYKVFAYQWFENDQLLVLSI